MVVFFFFFLLFFFCFFCFFMLFCFFFFFFFSSRRRHTRCSRDWSSDVCSSDLRCAWRSTNISETSRFGFSISYILRLRDVSSTENAQCGVLPSFASSKQARRSEERRVGKSVELGGRRIIKNKKNTYVVRKRAVT